MNTIRDLVRQRGNKKLYEITSRNIKMKLSGKHDSELMKIPESELVNYLAVLGTLSKKTQAKKIKNLIYILPGLGICPEEASSVLKELFPDIVFSRPNITSVGYYPYTIPLQLAEIIWYLSKESGAKQQYAAFYRRLRLAGLFFQSYRLDYLHGKPMLHFSFEYMRKYVRADERTIISDIKQFIDWGLIKKRQGDRKENSKIREKNVYYWQIDINTIPLFPFICIEPGKEYFPRNKDEELKLEMSHGEALDLLSELKRIHNEKKSARDHKPLYSVPRGASKLIQQRDELMKKAIETLPIDLTALYSVDKKDYHIISDFLNNGIQSSFPKTRSGRIKANRSANHLNTSLKPGKYGYSLWNAIDSSLYSVDFSGADILSIATLSGDKKLLEDYSNSDIYALIGEKIGLTDANERKNIKFMVLASLYGIGDIQFQKWIDGKDREREKEAIDAGTPYIPMAITVDHLKKLRAHFRSAYPDMTKYKNRIIGLAHQSVKYHYYIELFNGHKTGIEAGREYALVPIIMQSFVSYLTTMLFLYLERENRQPVFDRHDEVICREPVDLDKVNSWAIEKINSILKYQKIDYTFNPQKSIVSVKSLLVEKETQEVHKSVEIAS
jgi:hypothetical protein